MLRFVHWFPLWVTAGSVLALLFPPAFTWFLDLNLVTPGLQVIMLGMGLTLTLGDFARVVRAPKAVLLGVLLQYSVMVTASYRDHVSSLQDWLAAAKPGTAIAFGAACAERQWPVYTRATHDIGWAAADTLRAVLDALWAYTTGVAEVGAHLVESAQAAIPTEIESDAEAAAFEIATGIWGLATAALEREPTRVVDTAKTSLNLIEAFLYEELGLPVSPASDATIDARDLMQPEIFRQRSDWTTLGPDAAPPVIGDLRKRWVGESILAGFWYA